MIAQRQQYSPRVTRPSMQQEWRNYMPHMSSPTTAFRRKSFLIGTPVLLLTSLAKYATYLELSRTSRQHTTHKQMAKAREQTSPWNSTYACTVALIRKTGQLGYHWPSTHGTPGLTHPPKNPLT